MTEGLSSGTTASTYLVGVFPSLVLTDEPSWDVLASWGWPQSVINVYIGARGWLGDRGGFILCQVCGVGTGRLLVAWR